MNIKRGKSLIAFVLVMAMLLTAIPTSNRVMASETGSVTLEFTERDASSNFKFNARLSDGNALPKSNLYMVEAIVDGIEQIIAINAANSPTAVIYNATTYYEGGKVPTQSLIIEKGATVQAAERGKKDFLVPTGENIYSLSEEITILKNTDGTWSEKVPGSLNLDVNNEGMESGSIQLKGTLADGSALPKSSKSFYMVEVTVDGERTETIRLNVTVDSRVRIYGAYFSTGTIPTKTLTIAKDALFQEAQYVDNVLTAVPGGNKYYLSEEITIEKNSDGTWKKRVPGSVTLAFKEVNASNAFIFNGTVGDNVLPNTNPFYLVNAIIDGTEQQIHMNIQTNGQIVLYESYFGEINVVVPTKSLTFEVGTIFTEAKRPTGGGLPTAVIGGNKYYLSDEITIEKNEDGTWSEKVPESVTLEYTQLDASGNFIFKGTVGDSDLPAVEGSPFYLVAASVDGNQTKVPMLIQANGRLAIRPDLFTAAGVDAPTQSLTFEAGAIFTEARRDTTTQQIVSVVGGVKYRLSEKFSIVKNEFGLWDIDVATTNLGNLTMIFDHEDSEDNFYFVGEFSDEKTLTSATYYKGAATIDGTTTQYITLGINAEGKICIYEGYFTWKNSANKKVPENTFKIAAGTTFRQVYNENNSWKDTMDGKTPNIFTVKNDLSLVCIDDVWHAESITGDANGDGVTNVCDLVRYLKYNQTSSNTAIATGADINGNSIYDDIDDLRKLLVGEDIPTATNFSLVQNGESDYTIVTPANATANEQVAANELQYFIKEATGATLSIASETDSLTANRGKYLYVGDTKAAEDASVILASSAQKKNGYLIKTVEDDCYLRGYSDIGTKNSVYEFLDHAFDYEYYAVDEIYLTRTSSAKLLDYNLEVIPDFEWRMAPNGEVIYTENGKFATSASGEIANRMRFNLVYDSFVTGYDYHNSFTILPPATYQAEHPEWYSRDAAGEVIKNGTEPAQLCYSNEEMCTEFTQQLLSMLDSSTVENVMLGQQDTEKWCQCEECSAAYNKYGTNAAVLVKFANQVQAKVNAWFKENRTGETPTRMVIFAYQSTLKPPVIWDEESNSWIAIDNDAILNEDSSVMYAINDMQMHVPFEDTDPESLETPYGRLIGWDACSDSIYAWTYSLYMHHGLLFSNTIDVMAQNYSLLKKHGVSMIKEQADHYQRNKNSGFSRLETYLMSKMQWDTSLNQEELIDDFFNNYFGEAADTMQELFNGERQNILAKYSDSNLGFKGTFGEDVLTSNFWTESEVKEYQRLIEQAYDDIASIQTTNPTRYAKLCERIQLEAIQFDYIDCSLYSTDIETRNQFKNHFESLGLYSYAEHKSIGTLWKEWGIDCNQTMGFSEMSSDGKFNFHLHRETKPGPYKTTAYIDGTDQEIEIQVAEDGYSASITLNTNPNNTLKISKGAILMPVNDDGVKDISRPIYKLEAELYISNSTGEWKAGNEISKEPTNMTMTFNYVSDKDEDGKYDFNFKVNGDIQTAFYKAYAEIDGEVKPVLLRSSDASRENQEIWIYEGFFNDNAKSADSILPQVTLIFKAGTVLTPVTDSTYTVNPDMGGYILEQDVTVTYDNGTWE